MLLWQLLKAQRSEPESRLLQSYGHIFVTVIFATSAGTAADFPHFSHVSITTARAPLMAVAGILDARIPPAGPSVRARPALAPAVALVAGVAVLSTPFQFGRWSDTEDYPVMLPQTALSAPVPAPPHPSSSVPLAPLVVSGLIGPPPAETWPTGQSTAVAVTPVMIVQAQRDLMRLGHDPGERME